MHLKALWPWHWSTVRDTGATIYEECPCGQRRIRQAKDGFQPIDRGWLATGEWTPRPTRFPTAPSGVSRGGG